MINLLKNTNNNPEYMEPHLVVIKCICYVFVGGGGISSGCDLFVVVGGNQFWMGCICGEGRGSVLDVMYLGGGISSGSDDRLIFLMLNLALYNLNYIHEQRWFLLFTRLNLVVFMVC